MRRSLALLGRRGSGKTTLARHFMDTGYIPVSWADPVRRIFAMAYGDDVFGPTYPEVKRREYVVSVDGLPVTRTGRELLQRIGTDAIRENVDSDFWIKAGLRSIDSMTSRCGCATDCGCDPIAPLFVNDDTRFPNEVAALRSRGFAVVYLAVPDEVRWERIGHDPVADTHPSETSVSPIDADITVDGTQPTERIAQDILSWLNR